ncbi:hypothetical protein BB560_004352 [Smittium megazygosporum]|uniref:Cytidyltransferase-like domain-containing protein n=1 Tax=Smittium megazygosporum TaxID=133381 RepID=A0A2T9Z9N3_9FUNG|nr:hypothetical protein BB560_004352 [Smittium megazygosporum]
MSNPVLFAFLGDVSSDTLLQISSVINIISKTNFEQLDIFFSVGKSQLRSFQNPLNPDSSEEAEFQGLGYILASLYYYNSTNTSKSPLVPNVNVLWIEGSNYTSEQFKEILERPSFLVDFSEKHPDTEQKLEELSSKAKAKLTERLSQLPQLCLFNGRLLHTAVGGTFDHIHFGHKLLLSMTAYSTSSVLTCGISSEPLLKNKKYKEYLEPFDIRSYNTLSYLKKVKKNLVFNIVPLEDPYGPIITNEKIDSLVVSTETHIGIEQVNKIRATKSMPPMEIHCISLVSDHITPTFPSYSENISDPSTPISDKISSTEIRKNIHLSEHPEN